MGLQTSAKGIVRQKGSRRQLVENQPLLTINRAGEQSTISRLSRTSAGGAVRRTTAERQETAARLTQSNPSEWDKVAGFHILCCRRAVGQPDEATLRN
jgi:hypothetical protein